jgi:alkylhydroperoxidase family enzyme
VDELQKRYGDKVEFLAVYVREAHPTNGWRMEGNDQVGISILQPKLLSERTEVAKKCCSTLELQMPLLVDDISDRVGHLYSGMPDRLYLIDKNGRVAYKGGRGPFGYKPRELEQSINMLLLDQLTPPLVTRHGIPILSHMAAWKKLPPTEKAKDQPLPVWARALCGTLPRTTAALLELDYLHREKNPLEPRLRAKIRWVAAHINGCAYAEATAALDLRRTGAGDAVIKKLSGDWSDLPVAERAALTFARKMSQAAHTVTDAEMAQLMGQYGNEKMVAMVQLLAYANFQDRLQLALGVDKELRPLPALEVQFTKPTPVVASTPARAKPSTDRRRSGVARPESSKGVALVLNDSRPSKTQGVPPTRLQDNDSEWASVGFDQLQQNMEKQRGREPRILVPSWDDVKKRMTGPIPPNRTLRIKWSLVCSGYQPELAAAWSACTRAFGQEAHQDRVFEESLFWVVTRTLNCFY